ncbi:plastid division protein PDV1-like [Vicia villosa]|uniref:plastid division protein PDV1-like n=1 Tax=Vicia villosa TaxID=3911 RepID=UPI00273A7521|nr:plastid division protein PDV1-like [Vicia villosa]
MAEGRNGNIDVEVVMRWTGAIGQTPQESAGNGGKDEFRAFGDFRSVCLKPVEDLLNAVLKTITNSSHSKTDAVATETTRDGDGFVFVKDFRPQSEDGDDPVREAKSLNAIRTALENLEDHKNGCNTIQTQQRVERDAAIARLEQSRIVLAMRLSEHLGKKYKVIEEALAFVGDVQDASGLISPEVFGQPKCTAENFVADKGKRSNILISAFVSSFNFVKKSPGLDHMGGIVGNAALVAVSMIAMLHLHQVTNHGHPFREENRNHGNKTMRRATQLDSSSSAHSSNLDVLLARG